MVYILPQNFVWARGVGGAQLSACLVKGKPTTKTLEARTITAAWFSKCLAGRFYADIKCISNPNLKSALQPYTKDMTQPSDVTKIEDWEHLPLFALSSAEAPHSRFCVNLFDWDGFEQRLRMHHQQRCAQNKQKRLAFANWATPIARDFIEQEMGRSLAERSDGRSRLDTLPRQIHDQENYQGVLNPRWIETLMGVPISWVSAASLFTSQPKQP